jgi:integrase
VTTPTGGWRLTLFGLRRSEILGMRWGSVNLPDGLATVRSGRVLLDGQRTATDDPKSAASWRTVPVEAMHPGTLTLLRSLSARQATEKLAAGSGYDDSGYLLVDALGQPIRPEAYSDRFKVLCREAGVPVIRLHDIRHSVALMLHRAGQAPADVAALLGHTLTVHLATYVPRTERGA